MILVTDSSPCGLFNETCHNVMVVIFGVDYYSYVEDRARSMMRDCGTMEAIRKWLHNHNSVIFTSSLNCSLYRDFYLSDRLYDYYISSL